MRITPEDVLKTVRELGPVVPNKIKQRLEQPDSMLINIYLSDLQKDGKIRMTTLQLGSSSFAYTPEQIPKLESLIEHLNEKDRRVAMRLKQEKVIRASTQDPLTRVGLQTIKDFAKPIQVKAAQEEETFYRWYLISSEEAQTRIKELVGVKPEPETTPQVPADTSQQITRELTPNTTSEEKLQEAPVQKVEKPTHTPQQRLTEIQAESEFAKKLLAYFKEKKIIVHSLEEVRKGSEIDALINLPSAVGVIKYFCKAKSKKSSNDGDLAAAILTAKSKMLPALYITTGTVTKKAKENKELQEIVVVELGNSN